LRSGEKNLKCAVREILHCVQNEKLCLDVLHLPDVGHLIKFIVISSKVKAQLLSLPQNDKIIIFKLLRQSIKNNIQKKNTHEK